MSKNWAICIGINDYQSLKPLKYAQRDAVAMRDFCLNEARFEQVYFFAEGAEDIQTEYGSPLRSEPTFGNLERFFDVRFREPFLEAGDNLWFFFAGHGRRSGKQDYLIPMDGNPGNVVRTGLAIADISNRLRGCGADNIILMIDACRDDDDRDGGEGIGTERPQGMITLYSCSPNELSYEIDELQQGAFTYSLLQGLRIQGEGNCATVERLYQHLRYQVPELNQRYNKQRQTPYAIAEPATKLHFILLPAQATLQDVLALKNDALEAEAEADLELAEQLWIRVLVVSPGDSEAIAGIERLSQGSSALPSVPNRISRRQAIQILGFVGGGLGMVWLGRGVFNKGSHDFTPVEFETATVNAKGNVTRGTGKSKVFKENIGEISLELMPIKKGTFMMGSPEGQGQDDEKPQHKVTILPFLMGRHQVTQAQWRAVAALTKVERDLEAEPSHFKGDNLPVERFSWDDAVEFCKRLSRHSGREYRLPSEAEWEYACRAGTTTAFHFGETLTSELANYDATFIYGSGPKGEYRKKTTEVGSFPANAFGLYDMHGNVWEWCHDHWHENYQGAPTDGSAWITDGDASERRVLRGGSWNFGPDACLSALRNRIERDARDSFLGFRVVCGSS